MEHGRGVEPLSILGLNHDATCPRTIFELINQEILSTPSRIRTTFRACNANVSVFGIQLVTQ